MKFSTREDIEAPIDQVFAALCDFEGFERLAMRRGAEVQRVDQMTQPGVGMTWKVAFTMRGKLRRAQLEIVRFEPPGELMLTYRSPAMEGMFQVELMALSRSRTRMAIGLELTPLNLSSRLLVQSLKLAKTTLTKRFKLRVADYAKGMEDRLKASADDRAARLDRPRR